MEKNHRTRLNWAALIVWVVYPATLFIAIAILVVCLLSSCATQRESHRTHVVAADTLATELQADTHTETDRQLLDSLVTAILYRHLQESSQSEQENETVTETITIETDSTGATRRTEQRTTQRSATRQQQQREEQLQQSYEARMQTFQEYVDSIYRTLECRMQTHWSDSSQHDKTVVAEGPWYKRWWHNLQFVCIGGVLALGLWFTRRWWTALLRK